MKFKYDPQADAIYLYFSEKTYAYGKDLDDERRIDYASDNTPIGVELLCVSDGVNIDGLPRKDEITEILETSGIKAYTTETTQGYSGVVFDVALTSPARIGIEQSNVHLKEEVTA